MLYDDFVNGRFEINTFVERAIEQYKKPEYKTKLMTGKQRLNLLRNTLLSNVELVERAIREIEK